MSLLLLENLLKAFWNPPYLNPLYQRDDLSWLSQNVQLNRFGYRDRDFSLERDPRVFRIYSLGDSYTYGWYINDFSYAYPKVMEKILQDKFGQDKVEVINAARPGFNFNAEIDRFEKEGILFDPDLVTIGINLQDLTSKEFPPRFIQNDFIRNLRLYQATFGLKERMRVARAITEEVAATYKEESSQMKKIEDLFLRIKKFTNSINSEIVVIVFPQYNPSNPNDKYQFDNFHKEIERVGRKYSIKIVDLKKAFDEYQNKKDLVLNPNDPHPSVTANKIAAEYIVDDVGFEKLIQNVKVKTKLETKRISLNEVLPGIKGVISIDPAKWVYFDHKFDLGTQKIILPTTNEKRISYLEDILKTAMLFKHEGWPGAKIEYNLPDSSILTIPTKIYSFEVFGVSQVTGFMKKETTQVSEDLRLSDLDIKRNKENIEINLLSPKKYDLFRVTLDVSVRQFDIKEDKVIALSESKILKGKIFPNKKEVFIEKPGKIGSLPTFSVDGKATHYIWIGDRQVGVKIENHENLLKVILFSQNESEEEVELPVSKEFTPDFKNLPVIKYM